MKEVFIVNNNVYNTLEEAMQVANFMYNTNGVIAGVEKITPKKPRNNQVYSMNNYIAQHGTAQYAYLCYCYHMTMWHGETDSLFKVTHAKSAL
jgi:hypothetical protein